MAKAAILTMSVVQMGTNAISPILADIAAAFPQADDSSVQFLMTFPSLFVIGVTLLAAAAARYVPKKFLAAAGCTLFSISGLLSWLFHGSLPLLFVLAAVMGTGIGLVVPMATSLVTDCFTGQEQQTMMGWQSSSANVGAMLMTFLGGYLAQIHWSCNYLVYLIAAPGIFFSLVGLPRSAGRQAQRADTIEAGGGILSLLKNGAVWGGCLLSLLVTMLFNIVPTNLSMYMTEQGLGTSAQAGTGATLLLLSGTVAGLCFGKLAGRLGRYVMAFGFAMLCAGQLICAAAPNVWVVYLGCLVCGCAISTVMPQVIIDAATVSGSQAAVTSALIMAASNLGGFCAPVFTVVVRALTGQATAGMRFVFSAVCAALTAAAVGFVVHRSNAADRGQG